MTGNADLTESLTDAVRTAAERRCGLRIVGGGSKTFYGLPWPDDGLDVLPVAGHRGVLVYDPAELVLTARAGTPLREIEAVLAAHGQMFPFEPPHFGPGATLGGTVACGFSGPRRPFAGSVRDCVLGCRLINGDGQVLRFGGQVIKNVAGFDVSRLMVGALGTLGVLLEVSLRVMPRPDCERTLVFPATLTAALDRMSRLGGEPWPLSGLAADGNWLYVRLAGHERAVTAAQQQLGGDVAADGPRFWRELREHESRFFRYPALGGALWRLSVAPATPLHDLPGDWFLDWGGALRWLRTDAPADAVFRAAAESGGHATRFRGGAPGEPVFQPLPPVRRRLEAGLRRALDPQGLFNPGRLGLED